MIKYEIKTGSSFLNTKARNQREFGFKPYLKGMHCRKCSGDTVIEFIQDDLSHVRPVINACCSDFDDRIRLKLKG